MKLLITMFAAAALALSNAAQADPAAPASLQEGFNNVGSMPGWLMQNHSNPAGAGWFQGNAGIFGSHSGPADSYIAANYLASSSGSGTIDLWLLSPELDLADGSTLNLWYRTDSAPGFNDMIEVWYGSGTDTSTYTRLAGSISAPASWTSLDLLLPALEGRVALRYTGLASESNYIGIDQMSIAAPVPEPATYVMLCIGLAALLGFRHSRAMVACGAIAVSSAAFAGGQAPEGGMVVVRDPQTGQLRAPTPAEYRALTGLAASLQAGKGAPATPSVRRADGTVRRSMGAEGLTYSVISRDKDGKLSIDCVTGEQAAREAASAKEHGHETR